MRAVLLLLGLLTVCQGYMYLEKAGNSSWMGAETLRENGNIWNPPKKGGNRIPCGGKGNSPPHVPLGVARLTLAAGSQLRLVGKLTMPADDEDLEAGPNSFPNPFVELTIKYGDRTNFQMTRGHALSPVWAPKASGFFQLVRSIPADAYNNNATVQVAFHLSETKAFYQCIDIWVINGRPYPSGDFPWGLGPDDKSFDVPNCLGGSCGEIGDSGLRPAIIAIIVLAVLIALIIIAIVYCMCVKKEPPVAEKPQQFPLTVEEPPKEPPKPKTPPAATPPKEDSDNEPIGHVMYTPAEESDPTPQESSEQKSLDATGSQGRHFHFRYVEEVDDDDGAKESVA